MYVHIIYLYEEIHMQLNRRIQNNLKKIEEDYISSKKSVYLIFQPRDIQSSKLSIQPEKALFLQSKFYPKYVFLILPYNNSL